MMLLLGLTSCYSAIPVSSAPPPGTEVVLDMTSEATERMGGFLGRGVTTVRGRLLAWEPDSVVVAMIATQTTQGDEQLWSGERVAVPRDAIGRIMERRPNRGRTALAVLAGVALIATAFTVVTGGRDEDSGGKPKPPIQ